MRTRRLWVGFAISIPPKQSLAIEIALLASKSLHLSNVCNGGNSLPVALAVERCRLDFLIGLSERLVWNTANTRSWPIV